MRHNKGLKRRDCPSVRIIVYKSKNILPGFIYSRIKFTGRNLPRHILYHWREISNKQIANPILRLKNASIERSIISFIYILIIRYNITMAEIK